VYALRSALFAVAFSLWTGVVAILCTPILLGPARWTLSMFHFWGRGIFFLLKTVAGVTVEVRGAEHIPQGPALVAPKHQCMLDVYAQFSLLPASVFVMKKELNLIPWFGWYAGKVGAIDIDRSAGASALRNMVRRAKELFARGRQVVIFPEGTRGLPGQPGEYKPGIAALYRELDVPVCPVATNSGEHWPQHGIMIRKPGVVVFEYLEPIPPGLKRAEFMRVLAERIEGRSQALLGL
jgi:1-acyl-sn-glycerol-3-phosphate acyltransferase